MIVVSNATPIIALSSINKIDILQQMFENIYIPRAVYNEIKAKKSFGYNDIDSPEFIIKDISGILYRDFLESELDLGEAETIILAKELKADIVIIDEKLAHLIATNMGLNVTRTLAILLHAKKIGLVSELKPLLNELINKGNWYSKKVYNIFLKEAGEE